MSEHITVTLRLDDDDRRLVGHILTSLTHLRVHHHFDNALPITGTPPQDGILQAILKNTEHIIMTQAEATAKLNDIGTQLTKVGGETTTLLTKVDDLTKALADAQANGGTITPGLEAAINAVSAQATVVDDLVPDAPVTT